MSDAASRCWAGFRGSDPMIWREALRQSLGWTLRGEIYTRISYHIRAVVIRTIATLTAMMFIIFVGGRVGRDLRLGRTIDAGYLFALLARASSRKGRAGFPATDALGG